MRMYGSVIFVLLLWISIESNASKILVIRKLAEISQTPSPSPVSPQNPVVKDTCEIASNKCRYQTNMTACVSYPGTGPEQLQLVVVNDGEAPLKVKVTILPANESYSGFDIPKHETKKITIKKGFKGSSSIILNVGPGDCIIQMQDQLEPNLYSSYLTPTNCAVLLFILAVIIGVGWVSYKSVKGNRHLNGIPYQELEMGQPESILSSKEEKIIGWDESWDDDWDEDNDIKSTIKNKNEKELESSEEWETDLDN